MLVVIDADTIMSKPIKHNKTIDICICMFLPLGSLRENLNFFIVFIVSNNESYKPYDPK
jgi:hypothetical protein